jgi:hypothetical protein
MGCGASKALKISPIEEKSGETDRSGGPIYKKETEKELSIIKLLLTCDFDPLSLRNFSASGTKSDENWILATSFKVLCLPSQVVNVFQVISKF